MPINVPVAVLEAFVLAHKERVLQLLGVDESLTSSPAYSKFEGVIDSPASPADLKIAAKECSIAYVSPQENNCPQNLEWNYSTGCNPVENEDPTDNLSYSQETVSSANSNMILERVKSPDVSCESSSHSNDCHVEHQRATDDVYQHLPVDERCRINDRNDFENGALNYLPCGAEKPLESSTKSPPYSENCIYFKEASPSGLQERMDEDKRFVECDTCIGEETFSKSFNSRNSVNENEKLLVNSCMDSSGISYPNSITINRHHNVGRTMSSVLPGTYQLTNLQDWGTQRSQTARQNISNSISMGSLKDFIHRCSGPLISNVCNSKSSGSDIPSRNNSSSKKRPDYILLNPDYPNARINDSTTINMLRSTSMPTSSNANSFPPVGPSNSLTNVNYNNGA